MYIYFTELKKKEKKKEKTYSCEKSQTNNHDFKILMQERFFIPSLLHG